MSMLLVADVVGSKPDWSEVVVNADEHQSPLLNHLKKGKKPIAMVENYVAKVYASARKSNLPEGQDKTNFDAAGANRCELQARVEKFDEGAEVSWEAQNLGNAAGVEDELAEEGMSKLEEMARNIERAIESEQSSFAGDATDQARWQGALRWTQSGTTSQTFPTPAAVRPPSASIYTDTKANLNLNAVLATLQSQWRKTGATNDLLLVVGPELKNRFNLLSLVTPDTIVTQSSARVTNRNQTDTVLQNIVERVKSEYGSYVVEVSNFMMDPVRGGTTGKADWYGLGIHTKRWELNWHTTPKATKFPDLMGSLKMGWLAALQLKCMNPSGEAAFKPSDA